MKKNEKKIMAAIMALTALITVCVPAQAKEYYNTLAEVEAVKSYIGHGLYLEAMDLCDKTDSEHELSPDDIEIFSNLKNKALEKYDSYLNGTLWFSDLSEEIRTINYKTNYYASYDDGSSLLEGKELCEQTMARDDVSPEDYITLEKRYKKILYRYENKTGWKRTGLYLDPTEFIHDYLDYTKRGLYLEAEAVVNNALEQDSIYYGDEYLFNGLAKRARYAYEAYLKVGNKRISESRAISIISALDSFSNKLKFGYVYKATDFGDCYNVTLETTRNANGWEAYYVFDDGTYFSYSAGTGLPWYVHRDHIEFTNYFSDKQYPDCVNNIY